MIKIVKILDSYIENTFRKIKYLRLGKEDVQTSHQVAPFGIDSNPIKDMRAIQAHTGEKGDTVVIGYINTELLAEKGELRLFSVDSDGELSQYLWLKNDGTMEIGGSDDNIVRYSALKTAFDELNNKYNKLITALNSWTPAPGDGGTALKTVLTASAPLNSTADISPAKNEKIKTNKTD